MYDVGIKLIQIDQAVFLIDLPRLPNGGRASDDQLTPFAKELLYFLGAMGLPSKTLDSFRSFDYSNTNHLALVHSMYVYSITLSNPPHLTPASGGSHSGTELQRTGYPGLGRSVSSLGLNTDEPLELDYVVRLNLFMIQQNRTLRLLVH